MVIVEGMGYLGRKFGRRRGPRVAHGGPYYTGPAYYPAYEESGHVSIYDSSGKIVAVVTGRIVSLAAGYTTAPMRMDHPALPPVHAGVAVPSKAPGTEGVF